MASTSVWPFRAIMVRFGEGVMELCMHENSNSFFLTIYTYAVVCQLSWLYNTLICVLIFKCKFTLGAIHDTLKSLH